jgi:hypothetical protein
VTQLPEAVERELDEAIRRAARRSVNREARAVVDRILFEFPPGAGESVTAAGRAVLRSPPGTVSAGLGIRARAMVLAGYILSRRDRVLR